MLSIGTDNGHLVNGVLQKSTAGSLPHSSFLSLPHALSGCSHHCDTICHETFPRVLDTLLSLWHFATVTEMGLA